MASKNTIKVQKGKEVLTRIDGKDDGYIGGKFSIPMLIYLYFRSIALIQASFNYGYYQGTGYSYAIMPFLKKIYKNNKEKFKETMIGNIEFFNTGPSIGVMIITSIHLFMLQKGSTNDEVRTVKYALMGPFAGINDALFNFGSQPLIAGIAASLSSNGSWTGFWFYMLLYNGIQIGAGITLTILAYKTGEKFMQNISNVMANIVKIASMIGITVISALAITYTKVHINLGYTTTVISQGIITYKSTGVQEVLDKFLPLLLPIILVSFIFFMMTKHNWTIYTALVFILVMAITGSVYGIF